MTFDISELSPEMREYYGKSLRAGIEAYQALGVEAALNLLKIELQRDLDFKRRAAEAAALELARATEIINQLPK